VQELLFERGITVSHEAVRQWGRVAISTIAVRTPIDPHANENIACKGSNPLGMPNDVCPRMDPLPNISDHDGICCLRRSTVRRWGSDSRVGPKLRAPIGPPNRWGRPGRGTRLPDERLSLNNLTKPPGRLTTHRTICCSLPRRMAHNQ
jgi:hypothetical protein